MEKKVPPTEIHLYWYIPDYQGAIGHFSVSEHKFTTSNNHHFLKTIQVDFGDVEFDEVTFKLKALNAQLGEHQAKINYIKEEISKLTAIGHDGGPIDLPVVEVVACDWPLPCKCAECKSDDIPV